MNWATTSLGLFVPPFNLVDRVVSKILDERAPAIVVVPQWPTKPFWSTLMTFSVDQMQLSPAALQAHPSGLHPMRNAKSPPLVAFLINPRA
jgi:hypothetical protein